MAPITDKTLKRILGLPPYNYIVEFLDKLKQKQYDREYSEEDAHLVKTLYNTFSRDLNIDINEKLRLIEIEKNIIKLVESTDNNIFYRRLFFPSVFINNDFKFENWIIKGILIQEVFSIFGDGGICMSTKDIDNFNDYIIFMSAIDPITSSYWNTSFSLIDKSTVSIIGDTKDYIYKVDMNQKRRLEHYVRNIICNMVDMVEGNDEDLNVTIIESVREQNEKRIKKGKVPFPTKIYIRPKGEFKRYVHKFNEINEDNERRKLGHKFLVRGHWRNFRSPRYIHKRGEKTWVKPYWKGEGIVISKIYKLTQ